MTLSIVTVSVNSVRQIADTVSAHCSYPELSQPNNRGALSSRWMLVIAAASTSVPSTLERSSDTGPCRSEEDGPVGRVSPPLRFFAFPPVAR